MNIVKRALRKLGFQVQDQVTTPGRHHLNPGLGSSRVTPDRPQSALSPSSYRLGSADRRSARGADSWIRQYREDQQSDGFLVPQTVPSYDRLSSLALSFYQDGNSSPSSPDSGSNSSSGYDSGCASTTYSSSDSGSSSSSYDSSSSSSSSDDSSCSSSGDSGSSF